MIMDAVHRTLWFQERRRSFVICCWQRCGVVRCFLKVNVKQGKTQNFICAFPLFLPRSNSQNTLSVSSGFRLCQNQLHTRCVSPSACTLLWSPSALLLLLSQNWSNHKWKCFFTFTFPKPERSLDWEN